MALDPVIKAMLEKAAGQPAWHTLTPDEIRATDLARYALVQKPQVGSVTDRAIPGPHRDINIRVYRPDDRAGLPIVVFFHGGGFVICSVETHDGLCRQICARTGAIVVSVDYALAPEHKFPKGLDECLAATRWVAENADEIGGDPNRMALAGDSSGGNFAAVTALRIRDDGGPHLAAQLLIYPVTDHHSAGWPSYMERATGCGLTSETMVWFWNHYLDQTHSPDDPMVSPNRADNLAGLPPTYVVTAEYDPLRDEGGIFAERLAAAGVDTVHVRYDDVHHGFFPWTGVIGRSEEAMDAACNWLKSRLQ